jgi:hypothetical protein
MRLNFAGQRIQSERDAYLGLSGGSALNHHGKRLAPIENNLFADAKIDDVSPWSRDRYRNWPRGFYGAVFLTAVATAAALAAGLIRTSPRLTLKRSELSSSIHSGSADGRARALSTYRNAPMRFEANSGQMRADVKFIARGHGSSYLLTERGAILALAESTPEKARRNSPPRVRANEPGHGQHGTVVRMTVLDANPRSPLVGADQLPTKTSYYPGPSTTFAIPPASVRVEAASPSVKTAAFTGARAKGSPNSGFAPMTNVPNYARVIQRNIYPGVDLVYYGNNGQLEYDFVVAPEASTRQIRLRFSGVRRLEVNPSGDLVLHMETGDLIQRRPKVYEVDGGAKREIPGGYLVGSNGEVAFDVPAHNARRALVIDPIVVYSTYFGAAADESASGVVVDANGNAYLSVTTTTTDAQFNMTEKASVVKFDPNGSPLFAAILGAQQCQSSAAAIAIDTKGNAYITGWAEPVDQNNNCVHSNNAIVAKVDPSGVFVYYGIFPGYENFGKGIAVDSSGSAYITGQAYSGFLVTPGAFNTNSDEGPFVSKIDPTGTSVVYSTYLGGGSGTVDAGNAIAVDSMGNAYITGVVFGAIPFVNAYDTVPQPFLTAEAFVAVFNPSGTGLIYSTLLAGTDGTGGESGNAIALDPQGTTSPNTLPGIYVTGQTKSHDFPVTPGAIKTTCGSDGGCDIQNVCTTGADGTSCYKTAVEDAFVAKLDPNRHAASLVYSTFLGGSSTDVGQGIAVDAAGNAYVTGRTGSPDYYPILNSLQPFNSDNDIFVTVLNSTGTAAVFSTCWGGEKDDGGNGIALDPTGNLYVAGDTASTHFPIVNPFQSSFGGGNKDAFLLKIRFSSSTGN